MERCRKEEVLPRVERRSRRFVGPGWALGVERVLWEAGSGGLMLSEYSGG